MMEAHNFVTIDRWGKFRASTVPLNTGNDGTTAGLPQGLGRDLRGPHHTSIRTEKTPQIYCLCQQGFLQLKSGCSSSKFTR